MSEDDVTAPESLRNEEAGSPTSSRDRAAGFVRRVGGAASGAVASRIVSFGLRGVGVVIAAAVAIGAVVGTSAVPDARLPFDPPSTAVSPVPAAQQRVCPGPLLRLSDDTGQDATESTSIGRLTVLAQSVPSTSESAPLPDTDETTGSAPTLLTLDAPDSDDIPALSGSQSQRAASGDLVGLAAAECSEARGESWLVAGSSAVGRTTLVTLSNPTTVIATVGLTIFGPAGVVVSPGSEGIVVPPGSQRILSLAGLAPDLESPVVRVTSRGGQVVANLQQSVVRTLASGGMEIAGAATAAARSSVIPGLIVRGSEAVAAQQVTDGSADLETVMRMLVPGEIGGAATVSIRAEQDSASTAPIDGGATVASFSVDLVPAQVVDVPLPGLPDGDYTISIDSPVPVVSSARVSAIAESGASDLAWFASARALGDTALVTVAPGPFPRLHLANPSQDAATVDISGTGAPIESLTIPGGSTVSMLVEAGAQLSLSGTRWIAGSVSYEGPGEVASFTVTPPIRASTDVTVYR